MWASSTPRRAVSGSADADLRGRLIACGWPQEGRDCSAREPFPARCGALGFDESARDAVTCRRCASDAATAPGTQLARGTPYLGRGRAQPRRGPPSPWWPRGNHLSGSIVGLKHLASGLITLPVSCSSVSWAGSVRSGGRWAALGEGAVMAEWSSLGSPCCRYRAFRPLRRMTAGPGPARAAAAASPAGLMPTRQSVLAADLGLARAPSPTSSTRWSAWA